MKDKRRRVVVMIVAVAPCASMVFGMAAVGFSVSLHWASAIRNLSQPVRWETWKR